MASKNDSSEIVLKTTPQLMETSISMKHYDSLVGELRCPGCAYPMKSPICMCTSGHSVCHDCTKTMKTCPLCKKELTGIRSLTLEALASKMYFKCGNSSNGCMVRLPHALMEWHDKKCAYRMVNCFMGKVWDKCDWKGLNFSWVDHIKEVHSDKLFNATEAVLTWNYNEKLNPIASYYIFEAYNEIFNLYQVYDKKNSKMMWTMTCCSRKRQIVTNFAYEIELFTLNDTSKVICCRFPCHSEDDEDILQDGTCVILNMGDIFRFMSLQKQILNYRVRIIKGVTKIKETSPLVQFSPTYDIDFKLTEIEGVNNKIVPTDNILTRQETVQYEISNEIVASKETNAEFQSSDEDDPQLDAFVNNLVARKLQKSSTSQFDFNKRIKEFEDLSLENLQLEMDRSQIINKRFFSTNYLNKMRNFPNVKSLSQSLRHLKINSSNTKSDANENKGLPDTKI